MRRLMVVALLCAGLISVPRAASAAGDPPGNRVPTVAGDFDGDGRDDLAVGVRAEDLGPEANVVENAGVVHVFYGGAGGLSSQGAQLWTAADVGGSLSEYSLFGFAVAAGDFDGDGRDDLAVGAPYEDEAAIEAGAVYVLYGSAAGLGTTGAKRWTQNTGGVDSAAEQSDRFGTPLVAGNFGNGAQDDLAIGVVGESSSTVAGIGAVQILYGSQQGLTDVADQLWHQDVAGVWGAAEEYDSYGSDLAAADFGKSGHDDLAVGILHEDLYDSEEQLDYDAGAINVLYGSADGLSAKGNQIWHRDSPGVAGSLGAGDASAFGFELAAANFGKGAKADLAASVRANVGVVPAAGAVHVLYGRSAGLSGAEGQYWHQARPGVPGEPTEHGSFGDTLFAADVGRSGHGELIVGVPEDDAGGKNAAGSVIALYGSTTGVTAGGAQRWHQNKEGVPDAAEELDGFGRSVTVGNFGKGATGDLAVGAPAEGLGSVLAAGILHVLYGKPTGLSAFGTQVWSQDSTNVPDQAETVDLFGG